MCFPGKCEWPGVGPAVIAQNRSQPLLRASHSWLRHRTVRARAQIFDHVGPLAVARQAGEGHGCSGDIAAGAGQELVELVEGPFTAPALHGGGIIEALMRGALARDNAPKIRPDAVRAG